MGSLEAVARAVKLSTPKLFAAPPGRGAEDILSELAPSDKMPHELPRTELSRCELGKMAPRICAEQIQITVAQSRRENPSTLLRARVGTVFTFRAVAWSSTTTPLHVLLRGGAARYLRKSESGSA